MKLLVYAVIDTNVFISALITKNSEAATVKVLEAVLRGDIIPLYHVDILTEYEEVLRRSKFKISESIIRVLLDSIIKYGVEVFPQPTGEIFIDIDDLIFYKVAMEKRDDNAFLVTGNQKHYPIKDFIVTPSEMIEIIREIC
ncbi:MAG: putative toxin-antitoxin system toxin component, PIN family [Lachnospiraceae bacterium]|nr:putative toxin-antitoxin system toxin component, PIN family [Lachnospiraceae bacterium]